MNKRGISPVIATILLVLIVVVMIAIVWAGVRYFVSRGTEPDPCEGVDAYLSPSDVCFDSAKKIISVGITKGSSNVEITRMQFVFSYETADQSNVQETIFDANSKKLMYFDMSGIYSGAKPLKVKIIPVVRLSDGNERICEARSQVSIGDCDLKQEVGGYDGWLGCTTDQECIEKAGNNPNNISMTCVQILALKRGICCFRGLCSGELDDRGITAGGSDTPVGGIPKGCVINCVGKQCGPDGCGGSCGTCNPSETCNAIGQCVACQPQCTGKECGDDNCGGSCGSCASFARTNICYQESADITNQGAPFENPDGNCNLNYGGGYYAGLDSDWIDLPSIFDGDWETYGYGEFRKNVSILITYKVPLNANSFSSWKINLSNSPVKSYTIKIPQDCWNLDSISFRINSSLPTSASGTGNSPHKGYVLSCLENNGGWFNIETNFSADSYIYEEAMIWNITKISQQTCSNNKCTCKSNDECKSNEECKIGVCTCIPFCPSPSTIQCGLPLGDNGCGGICSGLGTVCSFGVCESTESCTPSPVIFSLDMDTNPKKLNAFGVTGDCNYSYKSNNTNLCPENDPNGKINGSYSFNSSLRENIYFRNPSGLPIYKQDKTISAWFKTSTCVGQGFIIGFGESDNYPYAGKSFGLSVSNGSLKSSIWAQDNSDPTQSCSFDIISSQKVCDGNWHFAATTYQDSPNAERILYLDGVKVGNRTGTCMRQLVKSSLKLYLGNWVNGVQFFNGNIDEVRIYNRTLSEKEISDLYNSA